MQMFALITVRWANYNCIFDLLLMVRTVSIRPVASNVDCSCWNDGQLTDSMYIVIRTIDTNSIAWFDAQFNESNSYFRCGFFDLTCCPMATRRMVNLEPLWLNKILRQLQGLTKISWSVHWSSFWYRNSASDMSGATRGGSLFRTIKSSLITQFCEVDGILEEREVQ